MICDAKYYAYAKHDFFIELKNATLNLDEKLVTAASKVEPDKDVQNEFIYSIHEDIMQIFKLINKNYHKF